MTRIKIIKKKDTYSYKYDIVDEDNNVCYVTKSGFKTPEEALEEAKKSYDEYLYNKNNKPSIYKIEIKNIKEKLINNLKDIKVKNLKITDGGYRLVEAAVFGTVVLVATLGSVKVITDIKSRLPKIPDRRIESISYPTKLITAKECNFSNIHIIIRTNKNDTIGVATATNDMLTRLGISNEIVDKSSDLSSKVSNAMSNNTNNNIVIINLDSGLENKNNNKTIIMGDSSNNRKYSSDILAACIDESLYEYNLNPVVKSGKKAGIWREQTNIEKELVNSTLINKVSQLTIDLPHTIVDDEIIKNDAAASIVEGIMRWTYLDPIERYDNIYYTTGYGDTLVSISNDYGISIRNIEENSDINMHKGVRVGNTVRIYSLPTVATEDISVCNPYVTSDHNQIKQTIIAYAVQSGDTVSKIANMYGVRNENITVPSDNINNIYVGDTVYITTYNLYETHPKTKTKKI